MNRARKSSTISKRSRGIVRGTTDDPDVFLKQAGVEVEDPEDGANSIGRESGHWTQVLYFSDVTVKMDGAIRRILETSE